MYERVKRLTKPIFPRHKALSKSWNGAAYKKPTIFDGVKIVPTMGPSSNEQTNAFKDLALEIAKLAAMMSFNPNGPLGSGLLLQLLEKAVAENRLGVVSPRSMRALRIQHNSTRLRRKFRVAKAAVNPTEMVEVVNDVRRIFLEMLYCRAIDAFENYLSKVLSTCVRKNPGSISYANIGVSDLLDCENLEEALDRIIEREVYSASFGGLKSIADFMKKRFGLELDLAHPVCKAMLDALEVRHLFVHQASRVTRRFLLKTGRTDVVMGDLYRIDHVAVVAVFLLVLQMACEIDAMIFYMKLA